MFNQSPFSFNEQSSMLLAAFTYQVEQIERNRVVMDHDNFIPVGDSYKTMFQEYLMSHSIGKGRK